MIETLDSELLEWAVGVVEKPVVVSLDPPSNSAGPAVSIYLMALSPAPPLRGERRAPIQLGLRYLVSTWAPDPADAHRLLGSLVLAAMTREGFEVELEPPQAEVWAAFGAVPRPAFHIKVPLRQELPEIVAKLVRKPLVVQQTQLTTLFGQVVGPGDVPLAGARVEIPNAELATETDYAGRFVFQGVPADPAKKLLRVRARRHEMTVETSTGGDQPVLIRFAELED